MAELREKDRGILLVVNKFIVRIEADLISYLTWIKKLDFLNLQLLLSIQGKTLLYTGIMSKFYNPASARFLFS